MAPPFRTNPSAIARYFFHDCERFLYYGAAEPKQRQRLGIPKPEFDHSPLVAAILASGYQWEEYVVQRLLKGRVVVAAGPGDLHTRRLSVDQTLHCLRREPAGRFLYQPTLAPPPHFYQTYGIDPNLVALSDNHPDLVAILADGRGRRRLRVIDVKRGQALKLTHRVQVLLYALQLQALLEDEDLEAVAVELGEGAVWLGQQAEPELFNLSAFRPHLERFLCHDLGRVLAGSAAEAAWHLYPRCEWCEFFSHCRQEMRRSDDVSRLPQLTAHGKRHLREEAGVCTLSELGRFLKSTDADDVLDRCASLAGQRQRLQLGVAALETNQPHLLGAASPDLPRGENIGLFLTMQQEPLGQAIYLAGLLVTARAEVRQAVFTPTVAAQLADAGGKATPRVWLAATPAEVPAVRRQFVQLLHDLLQQIHRYNAQQKQWKDQLTLQAYVHTEEERGLLFTALLEGLREPDLANQAMTLLFHFQGPELLQADQHPGSEVAYPVVVLNNAVQRLLALPVEVSYTLPEMLEALASPCRYVRRDYYHFALGHGLRAEAVYAAWYGAAGKGVRNLLPERPEGCCAQKVPDPFSGGGREGNLEEIRQQARLYLQAVHSLLRAVREHAAEQLVAWPPRFQLPQGTGIQDRLLSRLAFFARYESLLRCLAIRAARAEARPTQVLLGQVIELKARSATDMEVVGSLVVAPEANGFPAWLLVRDTDQGRRAQVEYADYWYRHKVHGGPDSPHRAVAGVHEVATADSGVSLLRLSYARPFRDQPPARGERFLLYPRFTDFTTDGTVQFLEQVDRSGGGLFLQLLRQPEEAAAPLPLPAKITAAAGRCPPTFTLSQRTAFEAICRQRVTAVWGPPGTGKTHFLAATIIALASAQARSGRPFRVLVTAFTHAAIENLLRKIAELLRTPQPRPAGNCGLRIADCRLKWKSAIRNPQSAIRDLWVAKAKYWQTGAAPVDVIPEAELGEWLFEGQHVVLGATVYSCLKKHEELVGFDLVVIDEASQVRVPEAAMPISLVGETGRLVLAGDHLQLPPIVAGAYPEPPPGEPLLHRSIFEAVCPAAARAPALEQQPALPTGSLILQPLLENFRMNDVLTSFAAQLLYGPGYGCVTPEVASRRLAFKPPRDLDPLVAACLDPAYPLVVVILDGIRAAQANPVEADLVAQMTMALRDHLCDAAGQRYTDDAAFFRHGLFVVSPHHAQIQAIQRELARLRSWQVRPFVDTVDKMQGQEADAVLVSYGVADPEFALHEAEFIYGLNRLNVAMTRARCKSVLCLPRPLLEASPQVLDVEAAALGLAFMRRLVAAAQSSGEEVLFEGDDVVARVLRVRRPLAGFTTKRTRVLSRSPVRARSVSEE